MSRWRDVLLDWINCTELMKRQFLGLNKINANSFYRELRNVVEPTIAAETIGDFLKDEYPHFDYRTNNHTDEDMFALSLLLHYSCVKSPCSTIRDSSKTLRPIAQSSMASFFTVLLGQPKIDRAALRRAIDEANEIPIETDPNADAQLPRLSLSAQSSPGNNTLDHQTSPQRPPLATPSSAERSSAPSWSGGGAANCSTPRTKMLDEWNSENRQLRAQIETERDERQFLEGQLKQYEERIETLSNERKALSHDLLELKNKELSENTENVSPNKNNNEEQLKRRLRKEIADRDHKIETLTSGCEETREANAALVLRLEHVDKQLHNMEQRSIAHMQLIEELQHEMEMKNAKLHTMQQNNQELESFLREMRRNENGGGGEMDVSIECVDTSFVCGSSDGRTTDRSTSGDSTGSPQSLAQQVVDVQLRDEQVRNQQLLAQLDEERQAHGVREKRLRNELAEVQATTQSLRTTCQLEHLQKIVDLAEAMRTQQNEHDDAVSSIHMDLEYARCENTELMDQMTRLNAVNQDLVQQISIKEVQIDSMDQSNGELMKKRTMLLDETKSLNDLVAKLNASLKEHQRVQNALEAEDIRLKDCVRALNTQVDILTAANAELLADNSAKHQQVVEVQQTLRVLHEKIAHVENKLAAISTENARLCKSKGDLQKALQSAELVRTNLDTELGELKSINEDQIRMHGECQAQCMRLEEELLLTRTKALRLEKENNALAIKQGDLLEHTARLEAAAKVFAQNAADMNQTISEMKTYNETLRTEVCEKLKQLQQLDSTKNEIDDQLAETKQQLADNQKELREAAKKHAEATVLCTSLADERAQLLDRISTMGKALIDQRTEFDESNGALSQEIASNQEALVGMRVEFEAIKEKMLSDSQDTEQLKEEKRQLTDQLDAKQMVLSELEASSLVLGNRLEELTADVDNARAELVAASSKCQSLEDDKKTLEVELSGKLMELTVIEAKLEEAQKDDCDEIKHLKDMQRGLEEQVEAKLVAMVQLKDSVQNLLNDKDQLMQDMQASRTKLDTVNVKCQRLEEGKHMLEQEMIFKTVELNAFEQKLCETQKDHSTQCETMRQHADTLQSDLTANIAKCELLEHAKESLEQQLVAKSNELAATETKMDKAEAEHYAVFETLRLEIDSIRAATDVLNENCYALEDSKKTMAQQLTVQEEQLFATQAELLQTQNEFTTSTEAFVHLQAQHCAATSELQELQLERQHYLQNAVEERVKLVSSIDALKQELESNKQQIAQFLAKTTRQEEYIQSLKVKQGERDAVHRELEVAHKELQKRLTDKEDDCTSHWRTVNELMAKVAALEKSVLDKAKEQAVVMRRAADLKAETQLQLQSAQDDCVQLTNELNEVTKKVAQTAKDRDALQAELEAQERSHQSEIDTHKKNLQEKCVELESIQTQTSLLQTSQQDAEARLADRERVLQVELDKFHKLSKDKLEYVVKCNQLEESLKEQSETHQEMLDQIRAETADTIASVVEQVNVAKAETKRIVTDYNKSCAELEHLRTEKTELAQILATCDTKCAQHQLAIAENVTALADCKQELKKSILDTKEVTEQLDAAKTNNAKLAAEHAQITVDLEQSKQQLQSLTEQLSTALANYNDLLAELQKHQTTIAELTERQLQLESTNEQLQHELDDMRNQAQTEHTGVVASARQLELEIIDMKAQMTAIERERDQLLTQIQEHTAQSRANDVTLADLSAEYSRQNEQLMQQTQLITDKSTEIQELRRQLNAQSKCSDQKYEELQAKYEASQTSASELKTQLVQSKEAAVVASKEISEARCRVVEMTQKMKEATTVVEQLEAEKDQLSQLISGSDAKCAQLDDNKLSLVENMASFVGRIKRLEDEKEVLARDVVVAMSFKERLEQLEQEVAERTATNEALEQRFADLGELLGAEGIAANGDVVLEVQRLQDVHKKDLVQQQTQLQSERETIVKMRDELETLRAHCNSLEAQTAESTSSETIAQLKSELLHNHNDIEEQQKAIAIFRAKLIKEREASKTAETTWTAERTQYETELRTAENRVTETRSELEGKLEKMKTRMKTLYNEESRKIKAKHEAELVEQHNRSEQQLFDMRTENHQLGKKIVGNEEHIRKLSHQIFKLNEQALDLKKDNEFMKNKLRSIEDNPHGYHQRGGHSAQARETRIMPASSMSSLIRMEDEDGEQFSNTYLDEMLSGRPSSSATSSAHNLNYAGSSAVGRESTSVPLSELKFRNSLLPSHLRSSYAVQYADQLVTEDDIKGPVSLPDESFLSTQSADIRRGTLYQKPGPPTPSKNGGRLSFGGTGGGAGAAAAISGRLSMDPGMSVLRDNNNPSKSPPTGNKLLAFFGAGGGGASSSRRDENATPKRRLSLFKRNANR